MRELLTALHHLRRSHGPGPAIERLKLLTAGRTRPPRRGPALVRWHDELLYVRAYPDSPAVLREADAGLHELGRVRTDRATAERLVNSGLAGTEVEGLFSADLLRWMAETGPDPIMTWDEDFISGADEALSLLLLHPERDALLADGMTTKALWRFAAGRRPVRWILDRATAVAPHPEVRERLFESLKLAVRWRLGTASRTLTRFPERPVFYQTGPLVRHVALGSELAKPLPPPPRPSGRNMALVSVARATLTARARETDTITWANPDEVELFRLERGVDVALIGLDSTRRLPVESYFGFVAARNRVPMAYGGGWVFFGRCEIGVNLFPEFRGGESAFLFAQVLRTYRQRYRVEQFLVDPYQFGKGNPEAIRSGAFWFYYRLGFRPTDVDVARDAATEWSRLHSHPAHQTAASLLRRFTASPLFLNVAPLEAGTIPALEAPWHPVAPDLPSLGLAVTRWIAQHYQGDRVRAQADALRLLARALGAGARPSRRSEREWFERLAPLAAMIPELGQWPPRERRLLAAALAAKGGRRERDYALRLQQLPRLRQAWQRATHLPSAHA
jgi:hypothetical protein